MIKQIETNKEVYERTKELGHSNLVATILAKRINDVNLIEPILNPTVDVVPPLNRLLDGNKAAFIIYNHLIKGSNIVVCTDSDSDGTSSAAIAYRSIIEYFGHDPERLHVLINERRFGNGVNDEMIKRTLKIHEAEKVDLFLTADHGAANDDQFEKLKHVGIEMVITDHHLIPKSGELTNVNAFVNPQREGCKFSKNISGCHVIYLVMQLVYDIFEVNNHTLKKNDRLQSILPIMTNTILSDQMDMSDPINRYYLKEGLKELSTSTDNIWLALRELLDIDKVVTEETVSFVIAPLLNAANRVGKAYIAYEYLSAPDFNVAISKLKQLINLNNERKTIESEMLAIANNGIKTYTYKNSLVTLLPRGMGVAGLISQTLGDKLQVPAFTFVENRDGYLTGSGRGINKDIDLKMLLDNINEIDDSILVKYGGHKGAAGCSVNGDKLQEFMKYFDEEVVRQLPDRVDNVIREYDFEIPFEYIGENVLTEITKAGPYGRGFPKPTIKTDAVLDNFRLIGRPPIHSVLVIYNKERTIKHEAFYPKSAMLRLNSFRNKFVEILFSLGKKRYLGKTTISPTISYIKLKD